MKSVGNPVSLCPHVHIPFHSASSPFSSAQFLSLPCQIDSFRSCSGFHQTISFRGCKSSPSVIPSNFLRPCIPPVEGYICSKLSGNVAIQAISGRLFIGLMGNFSRGRFLTKSQNDNLNSEGDTIEEAIQASVEQSRKLLALQQELLEKEDQQFNSTEETIEMQNVRTHFEEKNLDVSMEESPISSLTTVAAESLAKDSSSPGTVPEESFELKSEDVQVHVKEGLKLETEKNVKVENGAHPRMGDTKPTALAGPNVMNIIMVAAECAPWSKTGGLGDVVGALPKALARRGHRVMAVAPRYSDYHEVWDTGVRVCYNVAGQDMEVGYFHGYVDGVDYVFIDHPIFHGFANNIYGGSRQVPWHVPCGGVCYGDGNLLFIANDWHTALLPVYLKAYYHDHGLMKYVRCVIVIHNIAHQGRGPVDDFRLLTLPDHYLEKLKLNDPIGGEHLNIFMAGLKTAHRIVAVSHGYAQECQTQAGGWGLHDIVKENASKLRGIVNGIDDKEWNPELDVHLKSDGYVNYSAETLETGKPTCKSALQRELGLPVRSKIPLIGFIGRLDHQKGVDLIANAMPWMMEQDLQLVMLGTGRKDLEDMLRSFECQYRDKVRGWVGFSVKTSHRITAGADIILMPSRFEPCGLNQLYAMRYGSVPVVRAVGGLKDTVKPFDPFAESGLGWAFERAEASALIHALGNALWTYRDFKQSWLGIQKRCMSQNLSWDNAAEQYEDVLVAAKYQW